MDLQSIFVAGPLGIDVEMQMPAGELADPAKEIDLLADALLDLQT